MQRASTHAAFSASEVTTVWALYKLEYYYYYYYLPSVTMIPMEVEKLEKKTTKS